MLSMKPPSLVRCCIALAALVTFTEFAAADEPAAAAPANAVEADAEAAGESADDAAAREDGASETPATRPSSAPAGSPSSYIWRSMSDEELAYEFERTSLGGPTALTVVGGVIAGLALPTFLMTGIGAVVCHAAPPDGSNPDCSPFDTIAAVSGISTAVFGTMTIVGVLMLDQRSQKRSGIKNELWRRQQAGASLKLGLAPVSGGSLLAIGGQF